MAKSANFLVLNECQEIRTKVFQYLDQKNINMVLLAQFIGALYGLLAVVFGAFGAHILKKSFTEDQLKSFETGVKYQMYHALLLLMLSFNFNLESSFEKRMIYCFVIGTFLFSFSIYALTFSASKGKNIKFQQMSMPKKKGKLDILKTKSI